MRVRFHPDFPKDIRKFSADYGIISPGLETRFRGEVDSALAAIQRAPVAAGHILDTGSRWVPEFRRRNLRAFPFFVLYGISPDQLIFGALIPTRSDPLTWLNRFN